ncbi:MULTISPECIES: hypothetical protein [Bacillus cereus group]|uniref:hypothetical protein n=1 Tax=Bacillus cereus group TaxID=86661 RepID=UPI0007AB5D98|nr:MULTISPECIES: hypothetical protein [unclassified Bacillus cereus group]KZD53649.1 hypothetical protein B4085_1500 [Bacillus cereus]MCX3322655.1 hypothetical protein [Bacillus paranthracis]KZD58808.1 hypothetical protein B4116_4058 [Bacillus cereus]MDX5882310.1 hypothetical protein [Bacillus cereus group sp. BfR-BA-00999]MDX5917752.1 hypothetical protein [Bacillus cereus group sp. BfR-BA-01026]
MKVNIKVQEKDEKYSVGDVIVTGSGAPHFIYKDPSTGKYSLLGSSMGSWASGCFDTLDNLITDLKRWTEFKHYPKSEYQLELVPIKTEN